MSDYVSFTKEPNFKFLIGPEEVERYVHPELIQRRSSDLSNLLTGPFVEGATRVAKFPDLEPETFDLFSSYVYFGIYILKPAHQEEAVTKAAFDEPFKGLSYFNCRWCRDQCHKSQVVESMFPFCSTRCKNLASNIEKRTMRHYCAKCCGQLGDTTTFQEWMAILCTTCQQQQKARKIVKAVWPESQNVSNSFRQIDVRFDGMSRLDALEDLKSKYPHDLPSEDLVTHAELHQFADMWHMEELKSLTLLKLHRDLMAFRLSKENAIRIVELLDLISAHTGEEEETKQLDTKETPVKQTSETRETVTGAAKTTVAGPADKIDKPALSLYRLVLEYATDQAACFEQYEALDQWVSKDGERALISKILYGVARKAQQQPQK